MSDALHAEPAFRRTVERTLQAASQALGLRTAFLSWFDGDTFRVTAAEDGAGTGLTTGASFPLEDSLCARFVAGAPALTRDALEDAAYRDAPAAERFRIRAYAAAEVHAEDELVGTLCVLDTEDRAVDGDALRVLESLAELVGHLYTEHRTRERLRQMFLDLRAETERRDRLVRDLRAELVEPLESIDALAGLSDAVESEEVRRDALRMAGAHAARAATLLHALAVAEGLVVEEAEVVDVLVLLQEVEAEVRDVVAPGVELSIEGEALTRTRPEALRRVMSLLVLGVAERMEDGRIVIEARAGLDEVVLEVRGEGERRRGPSEAPLSWSMLGELARRLDGTVQRPTRDGGADRATIAIPHT